MKKLRIYRLKELSYPYPPRILVYDPKNKIDGEDYSWFFDWVKVIPDDPDAYVNYSYDIRSDSYGDHYRLIDNKEITLTDEDVLILPMNPDKIIDFRVMRRSLVHRIYANGSDKPDTVLNRIKRGLINLFTLNFGE